MTAKDRKADRHAPDRWHPVSARLDSDDFGRLEVQRKTLSLSRRAAIIQAIRDWLRNHETTDTKGEQQ